MRTRRERRSSPNGSGAGPPPLRGRALRTVRFQEADPMGVVWHGRYPEFLEDGRAVLGQAIGLDYADFHREGLKAPIVRLEIERDAELRQRPVALGVETIFSRDQHILDEWRGGEID
ncbi:MAG: acyl-CoA thioesterase, partial [Candidatus Aminicenantales bacterium]